MQFNYCPICGDGLTEKEIGDEGLVSFCKMCDRPYFDIYQTASIAIVINEENEVLLLKQHYVSKDFYVLLAGFSKNGESIEETTIREIKEEVGLDAYNIEYFMSFPHVRSDTLMFGMIARVKKAPLKISIKEVDEAIWSKMDKVLSKLNPSGAAYEFFEKFLKEYKLKV